MSTAPEPGPALKTSHWRRLVGAVEDLTGLADDLPGEEPVFAEEGVRFEKPTLTDRDIQTLDTLQERIDDLWRLMREIDTANL